MKKFFLWILSILLVAPVSAYNVTIHYNWITEVISVNWQTWVFLVWNWSENNDYYTFDWGYTYTDVYYMDWYWKNKTERVINDLYFNWDYTVSYTWNQYTLLSNNQCWDSFTGYLPTFDVTWNITELDTWNVFNNFAENSLGVLLSNIPNYIQYVIMFMLLLFVLWIFRKLR